LLQDGRGSHIEMCHQENDKLKEESDSYSEMYPGDDEIVVKVEPIDIDGEIFPMKITLRVINAEPEVSCVSLHCYLHITSILYFVLSFSCLVL
jgi:hypothetical protein